jgi:CDP-diacylglycerol--inositol 3-phosphatidyltransferase
MVYAFSSPSLSVMFYFIGQGFDAVDGVAARYFNQCSKFGGLLDMLTDRMGTAVLMIVLSHLYPSAWGLFAFLIVLDVVSHWFQMYSTLCAGKKTHKGSPNPLLNFYYTFPYALLIFCCGNELFVMALYVNYFYSSSFIANVMLITFPIFAAKQLMNAVQLYQCMNDMVQIDVDEANANSNTGKK